jgi:guanylate kinase
MVAKRLTEGNSLMTREGILLVISGPSGVGKGTLCTALYKEVSDISYSISATSRLPRPGEVHGVDYYFCSRSEFEGMIKQDDFLEWAVVYGNLYGTPKSQVQEAVKKGKDIILEIDIEGARQIKNKFPDGVFVFIAPPSLEELAERLAKRGADSEDEIQRRLHLASKELENVSNYDYIVHNNDLETAFLMLKSILLAERCRVGRYIE